MNWRHDISPYSKPGRFAQTRQFLDQRMAEGGTIDSYPGLFMSLLSLTPRDAAFNEAYIQYQGRKLDADEKWAVIALMEEAFDRAGAWGYMDAAWDDEYEDETEEEDVVSLVREKKA